MDALMACLDRFPLQTKAARLRRVRRPEAYGTKPDNKKGEETSC
jgi:hypothetical protein